jgi:hypothetical protein
MAYAARRKYRASLALLVRRSELCAHYARRCAPSDALPGGSEQRRVALEKLKVLGRFVNAPPPGCRALPPLAVLCYRAALQSGLDTSALPDGVIEHCQRLEQAHERDQVRLSDDDISVLAQRELADVRRL